MLVTEWGQDMKQQKSQVGSVCDMAYFVLHLIAGARQTISQLVCNESVRISALIVVCGGGCRCRRPQYSECLCYDSFTLGCVGVNVPFCRLLN
jgi:hypothetical protein